MLLQYENISAFMRTVLDDADAAAVLATLGISTPIIDTGRAATGFIAILSNPADARTLAITVDGVTVTYEFDSGGGVGGGNIAVTIGGTEAITATNLRAAILANQVAVLNSAVHATDTAYIDLQTVEAGVALTLASSHPAEVAVQDNADELAPAILYDYSTQHTVTAAEVTRGRVVVQTPLATVRRWSWWLDTGVYDGTVSESGGQIEFANDGASDLAAGQVLTVDARGTL